MMHINAMMAAQTAATAAVNAETVVDAETQRDNARDEKINSGMADMEAVKQAGLASDAAADAEMAAASHVLRLFRMANALHETARDDDLPNTNVNESTTEANEAQEMLRTRNKRAINTAISGTASDIVDALNADGDASEATIVWPPDMMDDPDTDGDEFEKGKIAIQLSVGGNEITANAAAFDDVNMIERVTPGDEESDPLPDDEQIDDRNARPTGALGAFGTGYQMSATDNDRTTEAIVFTNKKQGTAVVEAVSSVEITGGAIEMDGDQIQKIGSKSGNRYTGVEFDHDDTDQGPPLMGYISCPTDIACSITIEDGEVTAISGYTFTGSRAGVEGMEADPMNDYLAFGIWLSDSGAADVDDAIAAERYTFGAFADGGRPADGAGENGSLENVEGTATYRGSATGVHSTASRVDFFYGNATLTADFDDLEVTGSISNIYAGGEAVGHSIVFDLIEEGTSNIDRADGSFNGRSRMGPGRTGDDGNQHYPFEGTLGRRLLQRGGGRRRNR